MPSYRVLIVDDQRDIRRVLSLGLATSELKVEVVDVPSAEEAMLVATHGGFDLMVSDVRLPGMSGLDLVRRIQKLHPLMKVMLMTGVADPSIRREVETAGADAFFYKPIEIEDFLSVVRRMLGPAVSRQPQAPLQGEASVQEQPLELADRLEDLRLKAVMGTAAVLTTSGAVVALAGSPADVYDQTGLVARLAQVYTSGLAVTQTLSQPKPASFFYLAGKDQHFYIYSISREHLLVLTDTQPFQDRVEALNRWLPEAVVVLEAVLSGHSLPQGFSEPEQLDPQTLVGEAESEPVKETGPLFRPLEDELAQVEVSDEEQAAIDALFSQTGMQQVQKTNLDDFWDSLSEEGESLSFREDSIPFDEALDLGLAPDDEEEG